MYKLMPLTDAYTSLVQYAAKTAFPVTTAELRKQLEIADDDTVHDEQLLNIIKTVTQQFEHDTQQVLTNETWDMTLDRLGNDFIELPHRPIQSISYIKYYDSGNTLQTLSTDIYALDGKTSSVAQGNSRVILKYNQDWPELADRWDAVTIRYVTGYGSDGTSVPDIMKQSLLLLATFYFEHRGEPIPPQVQMYPAYEHLVRRFNRVSYP